MKRQTGESQGQGLIPPMEKVQEVVLDLKNMIHELSPEGPLEYVRLRHAQREVLPKSHRTERRHRERNGRLAFVTRR